MKRIVIVVHRWLGVALAAVFLLWFVSGIVMMYRTFPTITARDRLERAPTLRPERIQVRRAGQRGHLTWQFVSDVATTWEQLDLFAP